MLINYKNLGKMTREQITEFYKDILQFFTKEEWESILDDME